MIKASSNTFVAAVIVALNLIQDGVCRGNSTRNE